MCKRNGERLPSITFSYWRMPVQSDTHTDTHIHTHTYTPHTHTTHTNTQPCACTLESANSQPSEISFPFRSTPSCDSVHQLFKFPCQSSQQVALMIRMRYPLFKNHAMSASLPPHLQLTCTPTFFHFLFYFFKKISEVASILCISRFSPVCNAKVL